MAADKTTNKDFTIRRHNGESYDALLPTTHIGQVYTDNTLTTTLDEHLTNVYAPITAIDELEDKKADKTALAAAETMLDGKIINLQNDKADKTALAVTDQNIVNLQNDKVNKTTEIIGLDLQNDILLTEFKTALKNATQSEAGLLSAEDKTHLDGLVALLENSDGNNVVDTIGEILEIFNNYPEGADLVAALNGKVDKVTGKQLSTNDLTDVLKNNYDVAYTHSQIVNSNPHQTTYQQLLDKPTTVEELGVTNVYTKPETYTQLEINNLLDNLSAVKGLKSTLLTPNELSNGDTISTNLLTNNSAFVVFTATNTSTGEIDSDTVPVSTIITGKKFVFFDNQEIVFTIGETNSTFETNEDVTLKINLLYLDSENVQAVGVEFDGSSTNYLENQENVQSAISKLDEELKTTNDSGFITTETDPIFTAWDKSTGISITKSQITDLIEATQSLSGLMSATDKQRLDVLHALLEEDEANTVVDSINEILEIFNNYPEGADLVSALAGKVDKVEGKQLSANDYTNTDKQSVEKIPTIEQDILDLDSNKVDKIAGKDLSANDYTNTDKLSVEKIPTIEQDILDLDSNKVDKIAGKDLSTEDYTTDEKNKLAGLTVGINVEVWDKATRIPILSDANKLFICSHTDNQALIIPTDTNVPFPIGTMITFLLISTYKVTFSGQSGVALASIDGLVELATQYGMVSLIKLGDDTWQLVGALE